MKYVTMLSIALLMLTACSNKEEDLKSPCAGTEDSPCARRPVNDHWLHQKG